MDGDFSPVADFRFRGVFMNVFTYLLVCIVKASNSHLFSSYLTELTKATFKVFP